ncbi:winged helix-turn-helix domain-containing protein [Rhodococcus wratislaviensis]|uniref:Uncharacterized protein n=1 Tax=Rhodococcus wratislaviensis NBRC 100605 TaxID=1219028 RepID=X0Q9K5_RHOWR|nr:winged helix-turn-helix domain-containing protein [Rhodococcus wratislaviensis]GAF48267.1 hypothetical protein RW1_051_00310 [Rhodococcus wratislaviensis NBRC 100605]
MIDTLEDLLDSSGTDSVRLGRVVARSTGALLAQAPDYAAVQHAIALLQARMPDVENEWQLQLRVLLSVLRGYQDRRSGDKSTIKVAPLRQRVMQSLATAPRTPRAIAQITQSPASSVGRVLRDLREEEFVQLAAKSSHDKRERPYALTQVGRRQLEVQTQTDHSNNVAMPDRGDSSTKARAVLESSIEFRRSNKLTGQQVARVLTLANCDNLSPKLQADCFGEIVTIARHNPDLVAEEVGWKYLDQLLGLRLHNDYVAARAYYELARWKLSGHASPQPETVREALSKARHAAEGSGNSTILGWCYYTQALLLVKEESSVDDVCRELQSARDAFKRGGDWHGFISAGIFEAKKFMAASRVLEAMNALEECKSVARARGWTIDEADATLWLGEAHLALGSLDNALLSSWEACLKYRASGLRERTWIALGITQAAKLACSLKRDADLTAEQCHRAFDRFDRVFEKVSIDSNSGWWLGVLRHRRGIVERELGQCDDAATDLHKAIEFFAAQPREQGVMPGLASLAELQLQTQRSKNYEAVSLIPREMLGRMNRMVENLPDEVPGQLVRCVASIAAVVNTEGRPGVSQIIPAIADEMGSVYLSSIDPS